MNSIANDDAAKSPLPLLLYIRGLYYSINKHIRRGIISGLALLVIIYPLPFLFSRYKGCWFWELTKRILETVLWPLKQVVEILFISEWQKWHHYLVFFLMMAYLFFVGFFIGALISYLTEQIMHKSNNRTESDFNEWISE